MSAAVAVKRSNVEHVLRHGGVLARAAGWRGRRTELRVSVRWDGTARTYDLREWYTDGETWLPGRLGMNGLCGAELRRLLALLSVAVPHLPRRGRR